MKKSKEDRAFGLYDWGFTFFILGFIGLLLGTIIASIGGNFVSSEYVITNTEVLEPVIVVDNKKKLVIRFGDFGFIYFIKNKQGDKEKHSISLQENDIVYEKGTGLKKDYKKVFKNKKFSYFFFTPAPAENTKIFLSSKDDIF